MFLPVFHRACQPMAARGQDTMHCRPLVPLRRPWRALALAAALVAGPAASQEGVADSLLQAGYAALEAGDTSAAAAAFEKAAGARPLAPRPRVEWGYALLALDQPDEAATQFEHALRLDPGAVEPTDLGHLYFRLGRMVEAADQFEAALRVHPDDAATALQLAYVYARQDLRRKAHRQFARVAQSPDPEASALAQAELDALDGRFDSGAWTAELYLAPLYQERFDVATVPLIARVGVVLDRPLGLQLYGSVRASRDTRSASGERPQIFSDNVVVGALGLRAKPSVHSPTVYVEAGPAIALVANEATPDGLDVRGGLYEARRWDEGGPGDLVGDLYVDLSYYSRYENGIGYLQVRPGLRLLRASAGAVDLYTGFGMVADTRGLYYNNVVEGSLGLRWVLPATDRVALRAEYVRGWQTVTTGAPSDTYDDVRVLLVLSSARILSR